MSIPDEDESGNGLHMYQIIIINFQCRKYKISFYCILIFQVDKYYTVQPHTLIRQHIDHGHWYDRTKLSMKEIHNTQYVACMNPTAGSFTIDSRLQVS